SGIERAVARWLQSRGAQDRILYLVLTKDVPLRIGGTGGPNGTVASVDSELTLLYRKLAGTPAPIPGSVKNPLFAGESALTDLKPFTHRTSDIYLVSRLDGYTAADVKALIDRGATPSQQGKILLDGRLELTQSVGNKWLVGAATRLRKLPGWSD